MKTKEEKREYNRLYRLAHKEELAANEQRYRENHREEARAYAKQYRSNHKKEQKEHNTQYYQNNKESIAISTKQYREEHKEPIRAYAKEYRDKMDKEKQAAYLKKWNEEHKEYASIQKKKWYKENKDRQTNGLLVRIYGITLEDYNRMLSEQNDCCAICGKHKDNFQRGLSVDHNHVTHKVRALLCHKCNTGLGNLGDDINILQKAIDYLNKYASEKEITSPDPPPDCLPEPASEEH
jgi:hypothetical protein